jgi:hypothetical protein
MESQTQADLFCLPLEDRKSKQRKAFDEFDAENPHVYELFCRFAFQAVARGYENFSARAIIHRIRWETAIETTEAFPNPDSEDGGPLKINNNHSPYYARKFMSEFPVHSGFFRTRDVGCCEQSCARRD